MLELFLILYIWLSRKFLEYFDSSHDSNCHFVSIGPILVQALITSNMDFSNNLLILGSLFPAFSFSHSSFSFQGSCHSSAKPLMLAPTVLKHSVSRKPSLNAIKLTAFQSSHNISTFVLFFFKSRMPLCTLLIFLLEIFILERSIFLRGLT